MATHSSILAWKIPWTESSGGLQSMESQRVRHDWAHAHKWNPTVFAFLWLISLSIIPSGPSMLSQMARVHSLWLILYFINMPHLPYPLICWWTHRLSPCLSSNTAVNMEVQIDSVSVFSRYVPRSRIAGSCDSCIFNFSRNLHSVSHSGCTNSHFHQQCPRVSFPPHIRMIFEFVFIVVSNIKRQHISEEFWVLMWKSALIGTLPTLICLLDISPLWIVCFYTSFFPADCVFSKLWFLYRFAY